jgi:hypothetical protein
MASISIAEELPSRLQAVCQLLVLMITGNTGRHTRYSYGVFPKNLLEMNSLCKGSLRKLFKLLLVISGSFLLE